MHDLPAIQRQNLQRDFQGLEDTVSKAKTSLPSLCRSLDIQYAGIKSAKERAPKLIMGRCAVRTGLSEPCRTLWPTTTTGRPTSCTL